MDVSESRGVPVERAENEILSLAPDDLEGVLLANKEGETTGETLEIDREMKGLCVGAMEAVKVPILDALSPPIGAPILADTVKERGGEREFEWDDELVCEANPE